MTLVSEEFYIIVPAEATNEILNPSFETNTTGYTAVGAGVSIARSSLQQRRGLWSLEITTATGVASGVVYKTVNEVASVARTFSVDIKGVAGQAMRIQIRDTAAAVLSETTFTASGYWQRIKLTRTGTANTTRWLYVMRDAVASVAKVYVDGLYYSTVDGTYLDGDMNTVPRTFAHPTGTGGVTTRVMHVTGTPDYYWTSMPHASTSKRESWSRSGGTMLRINDYARVLFTIGLGMGAIVNTAVMTTSGNSSYQTTKTTDREFILRLVMSGTPDEIRADRNALINAVRPDKTAVKQPLIIRYQGVDSTGQDATEPINIPAFYVDGLEDGPQDTVETINLRFKSYLPYLSKDGDSGVGLGYSTLVTNFANIGYRDTDGQWKAMGTGAAGGLVFNIIAPNSDAIYAGGAFTQMGGVASTSRIAKWNGSAWSALGTGALDGNVLDMVIGPDGVLYAGGAFTQMGGVANTSRIAKWNGSAWSALGTGALDYVSALAFGSDGVLYAGGAFLSAGGVANTARIAKWTGAAWLPLGTGMNGFVNALAFGPDGVLYAGGSFATAGGVAANNIAKWDGSTWSALGAGTNSSVDDLAFGSDGMLYVGGTFSSAGGVSAKYIAKWNGSAWSAVGTGTNQQVVAIKNIGGDVYVGGQFTAAGGVTMPDRGTIWNGSMYLPLDINVQDVAAYFYAFARDGVGRLYLGGSWAGTTALSATVTVSPTGNVGQVAKPVTLITGPGTLWQLKNYTTGKAIFFNNLTLLAGETATLTLGNGSASFTSSWRGDLSSYLLPGSNLMDWALQAGDNNVSAYMTGTTGASGIVMLWQDSYWSVDGAKR